MYSLPCQEFSKTFYFNESILFHNATTPRKLKHLDCFLFSIHITTVNNTFARNLSWSIYIPVSRSRIVHLLIHCQTAFQKVRSLPIVVSPALTATYFLIPSKQTKKIWNYNTDKEDLLSKECFRQLW